MEKSNTDVMNYLRILVKQWKLIAIDFLIVCFMTAGLSLVMPEWYRAYTTILPPLEEADLGNFTSLLSDLPLRALGLTSAADQTTVFLATLKSRTIMEAAASEFDLMDRYDTDNMEETVKELRNHVGANLDDEGTISLFAEAGTPWFSFLRKEKKDDARELARDMANFFIAELDRVNMQLRSARARNTRIFIEERYHQNIADLHKAEDAFKQFQEKYGAIALQEQTAVTISAASDMKAQIIAKEIEIGILKKTVGTSHSEYRRAYNELYELQKKYNEFKSSPSRSELIHGDEAPSKDLFLPLDEVPDLGLQYARLYREVMLQEKIMEFLLPQYEQAKIQEVKDTPSLQVLDEAVKPFRKYRPKRAMMVLFFGFLSLILSSMYVLFKPAILDFYQEIRT